MQPARLTLSLSLSLSQSVCNWSSFFDTNQISIADADADAEAMAYICIYNSRCTYEPDASNCNGVAGWNHPHPYPDADADTSELHRRSMKWTWGVGTGNGNGIGNSLGYWMTALTGWLTVWQTLMLMNIKWILLWHQKGPPAGLSWACLLVALWQPCGSESDSDRDRNSDSNCDSDSKRRRESGDGGESHRKDFAVAIGTGPSRRTYLAHKMLRLKNAKVEICVRRGRLIASDSVGLHRELCGQGKCIKN